MVRGQLVADLVKNLLEKELKASIIKILAICIATFFWGGGWGRRTGVLKIRKKKK